MIGRTNSSMSGGKIKSLNKSCVVWLPLNGNAKNYGNSDLTFYPSRPGIKSVYGGNIYPGCYCNYSHTNGGLTSDKTIELGKNQSFFCWMKFSTLLSTSNLGGSAGGQHRSSSCSGLGLNIKYVSASTGYLTVSTGNGSSRTYNTYCGKTLLTAGGWYHLGYTYDGTYIKLYVNGVLDGTFTITDQKVPADYIVIAAWTFTDASSNNTHTNYQLNGYIQDVRIYNKTLNEEEITTIYQWRPILKIRTKPVRYIRISANGSTANTSTHYNEIEIFNQDNQNIASTCTFTNVVGSATLTLLTDGVKTYDPYTSVSKQHQIQIDLKQITDISYFNVYKYWKDNRAYYKVLHEISTDGVNWETVYNSDVHGIYSETSLGHANILVPGP